MSEFFCTKNFEQLKADLEESKRKEKAYFKRIVAANNVLRTMPRDKTVYCGACGQKLKVAISSSEKEWFEALRSALLFSAEQDTQSEEKLGLYLGVCLFGFLI